MLLKRWSAWGGILKIPISAQEHSTPIVEKSALCRQPLKRSCKLPLPASSARSYGLRSASNGLTLCLLSCGDMHICCSTPSLPEVLVLCSLSAIAAAVSAKPLGAAQNLGRRCIGYKGHAIYIARYHAKMLASLQCKPAHHGFYMHNKSMLRVLRRHEYFLGYLLD